MRPVVYPPVEDCARQVPMALSESVDFSVIKAQRSFWDACELAMSVAGLKDKQVYMPLKIDKGHWSRIASGDAHFPHEKLEAFMDLIGNDIPLRWLAWRRGLGLHLLESEHQRQLREKDERIRQLELREGVLMEALRGRAA